jgi:hypothetical protein
MDERAVVADDGERIVLSIYGLRSASVMAAAELEPLAALRVAYDLIGAATRHLNRGRQ